MLETHSDSESSTQFHLQEISINQNTRSDDEAIGSVLSANTINIEAGQNLNVAGSAIVADNDINLYADEDINISSAATSTNEHSDSYTSMVGLFSTGTFSSTLGSQSEKTTQSTAQVQQVESQVVSLGGNVTVNAGNDVNVTASRLEAFDGDILLGGDNVNLNSAYNTVDDSYEYAFKQSGISGKVSVGVVDTAMAAADAAESASETGNSRLQAVQTARAALNANDLMDNVQAMSDGDYSSATKKYEISISLGSASASQSSESPR